MLTFYFAPGSSSMAVHIALHEVGVPFESRPISFARRDHRAPDYLALNPEGKVPTLLINGRPMTEVAAILYYLAKVFPAAGLLPEGDAEAEAQAISWMSFIAATLHPARRLGSRTPARYSRSPTGDWGRRHGRWGVTRLPISISSVSIGASPILSSRQPERSPASRPNTTA